MPRVLKRSASPSNSVHRAAARTSRRFKQAETPINNLVTNLQHQGKEANLAFKMRVGGPPRPARQGSGELGLWVPGPGGPDLWYGKFPSLSVANVESQFSGSLSGLSSPRPAGRAVGTVTRWHQENISFSM
jgi:hypothetical protein